MSKKTIPFQMPKKSANEAFTPAPESSSTHEEAGVDQWVHQQRMPAEIALADPVELAEVQEAIASSVTITLSAAPNLFEAVKIAFLLPYLTVWVWTLGAAQKNLRLFSR
jgi:hypothetical protein